MNAPTKRAAGFSEGGMAIIFLLAVCLSLISVFALHQMNQTADTIYDHPYTVTKEAMAMQTRLLDMRSFIGSMLTDPTQEIEQIQTTLDERYALHSASIDVIAAQYLGPSSDISQLRTAVYSLEETQESALIFSLTHTDEETARYLTNNLYAQYDEVNDIVSTILTSSDSNVQRLEQLSGRTAWFAILSTLLLTVLLLGSFTFFLRKGRKNVQEIRYREQLFDTLISSVDEIYFIYDTIAQRLEYISPNAARILGEPAEAFLRNRDALYSRIHPEDQEAFQTFLDFSDPTKAKSLDLRLQNGADSRWMRVSFFPGLKNGRISRFIFTVSDQTRNMRIQMALEDALLNAQNANAAKQNFLSRMSHEIRTPMNAIIGMTTIAAAYIEDQDRVSDCLKKIGYSSKHLMSLINDVLDMSKIDEGKMMVAHESFDLEKVAESITSIIYPQAVEKGLRFSIPLVDLTDTALLGDALRLNQILINLLSNALKFTPAGGSIQLEIRQLQKKAGRVRFRFTVSDTGIGMSEDFKNRLFLPFEQESATTGQKYGGTGLGLSISKNLVTLMGGTISVQSQLDHGSSFLVELDFDTAAAPSGDPLQPSLHSLKVLVADDNRESCTHTALLLQNMGILSDWVLSGQACIASIQTAQKTGATYDVCLIDWQMPDLDGIQVTQRIREVVGPDTTIIIIAAYDWSSIEKTARQAGADAFLSKPIFPSSLYNTLLSATGAPRPVQPTAPNASLPTPSLAGRVVLLVEDNDLNREIAGELLLMAGLQVDYAENGQIAYDKFLADDNRYDLILMDVQMPVMNGYQATEAIRKSASPRAAAIPIIAMTADAFHEDVVKATQAGMNGHLAKPIEPSLLYHTLAAFLADAAEG